MWRSSRDRQKSRATGVCGDINIVSDTAPMGGQSEIWFHTLMELNLGQDIQTQQTWLSAMFSAPFVGTGRAVSLTLY